MSLENMAMSANEKKLQNIMRLKVMFDHGEVVSVASVVKKTGYSKTTIIKWAKEGNIPLFDTDKSEYVVDVTDGNKPAWIKKQEQSEK